MKKQIAFSALALIGTITLSANTAQAHHGVSGQFDTAKSMEVTGVVTRIRLVNPHSYVYFDVKNEAGETEAWRCELRSGSLLKRKGWKASMFEKGTTITINGSPARNEPNACYTKIITFEDGYLLITPHVEDTAKNSTKLHIEERFSLSDDGKTLTREYTATDPTYIVGSYSGKDVVKLTTFDYEPAFICRLFLYRDLWHPSVTILYE